ncbi:MAG: hypothetical protein KDN22_25825 [Verrucomicrobiae bacterium]|nr:hypothetical protein [Verrucomicrobiae bacterium]
MLERLEHLNDPETAPNQLWQLLRSALPRWASFSPQQALAFAESLPEPPEYVGLALGAWAAADPAAALDMALVKSEEFSSRERSAAQLLDDYLRKIVGTLAVDEASAQGAVDLAQSIESPDTRQLLYSTLIDKLGANHHEEMLALIDEFEPMQRVALAEDLMLRANAWHVDGKSAEWALAQDSSVRESLLAGSIKHWHRLNPQAAENWVNAQRLQLAETAPLDPAVRVLAEDYMDVNAQKARGWIFLIEDEKLRADLQRRLDERG